MMRTWLTGFLVISASSSVAEPASCNCTFFQICESALGGSCSSVAAKPFGLILNSDGSAKYNVNEITRLNQVSEVSNQEVTTRTFVGEDMTLVFAEGQLHPPILSYV